MKKYNISKPEKYVSNGIEKTFWANVGTMTEWEKQDGTVSRIVEIPAIGLKANVFEEKPREPRTVPTVSYPNEEVVNPADVPDERVSTADQTIQSDDIPF